ncbi:MAG: glycosyltransferase family 4 protein [Pirellulaceae bacterium]|nr:glycosyltransferase family 4 protein [Pirellulaceae bacterium]
MKVLHCIPHIHQGGSDVGAIELVRKLDGFGGTEARLCVLQAEQSWLDAIGGVREPVELNFAGSHVNLFEFVRFRRALRELILTWHPDIVHCHLWPACRWVASALLGLSIRQVWHVRDTRPWLMAGGAKDRFLRTWTRGLIGSVRPTWLSVSCAAARYTAKALRVDADEFEIVSSGVDCSRFAPRSMVREAVPVIGVAAQFRPEKGHRVLLQALQILWKKGLEFRVRLAGVGETRNAAMAFCDELGLAGRVAFLGQVQDMPSFLADLDLFVLPSTGMEGLPLSVLEAMSMRVPVLATAVAGTPEIVRENETGYLVAPGDVRALADAIENALMPSIAQASMLDRAQSEVFSKHSSTAVAAKVHSIYQRILA